MFETIQEIINSPHTDWTAVTIMLIVLGVVVFNIVYYIVAKIKGQEMPRVEEDREKKPLFDDNDMSDPANPISPFFVGKKYDD